jgi:adenine phosphoribosyltransferase
LPRDTIKEKYSLEYGTDGIEIHADAIKKNDRVLIIDDLLATGGTAKATGKIIKKLNGTIVSYAFLIILHKLNGYQKLEKDKIFSILEL